MNVLRATGYGRGNGSDDFLPAGGHIVSGYERVTGKATGNAALIDTARPLAGVRAPEIRDCRDDTGESDI